MAQAPRDQNFVPAVLFESSTVSGSTITGKIDQATGRILTTAAGGSGTVTSVSVTSANGFAGTVATATTTPAITLSTTITGILEGNGTAISAASTTGSGAVVRANSPTFVDDITVGTAATSTGSILFKGLTSGTVTLKVADVAGTWTMTLPAIDGDSGQVLSTDGAGVTSWVSAGGVPTTITVANEATDTTCFPLFVTAATGDLGPKTNANLTFNSNTGVVTLVAPILGTPTSGTLTNCTGLPEGGLSLTDITTNDSTTSKHGFLQKLPGGTTTFLRADGAFATPTGTVSSYVAQAFTAQTSVVVTHSFGAYPIVDIIDNTGAVIVPLTITHSSVNAFTVTFSLSTTGTIMASVGSPQPSTYVAVSGTYAILAGDYFINATGGTFTATLPTAVGRAGQQFTIKNSGTGIVTIATTSSQTIDGQLTNVLAVQYQSITVVSDGANWFVT